VEGCDTVEGGCDIIDEDCNDVDVVRGVSCDVEDGDSILAGIVTSFLAASQMGVS